MIQWVFGSHAIRRACGHVSMHLCEISKLLVYVLKYCYLLIHVVGCGPVVNYLHFLNLDFRENI